MEKRFFTVQEANELIPFLSTKLQELRGVHRNLQMWALSNPSAQDIAYHGGILAPERYMTQLEKFQSVVGQICAEGCHLKDLETGLVDFPTVWEGREVYLCWKLGETEVGYWHEIEAGFAGRRSLNSAPET